MNLFQKYFCCRCIDVEPPLEPILHYFPYPHIGMEPSIRLNKEETRQDESSMLSLIDPKHIIHKYVIDYIDWQKEIWKKRLYYPYSLYLMGGSIVVFIIRNIFFK